MMPSRSGAPSRDVNKQLLEQLSSHPSVTRWMHAAPESCAAWPREEGNDDHHTHTRSRADAPDRTTIFLLAMYSHDVGGVMVWIAMPMGDRRDVS